MWVGSWVHGIGFATLKFNRFAIAQILNIPTRTPFRHSPPPGRRTTFRSQWPCRGLKRPTESLDACGCLRPPPFIAQIAHVDIKGKCKCGGQSRNRGSYFSTMRTWLLVSHLYNFCDLWLWYHARQNSNPAPKKIQKAWDGTWCPCILISKLRSIKIIEAMLGSAGCDDRSPLRRRLLKHSGGVQPKERIVPFFSMGQDWVPQHWDLWWFRFKIHRQKKQLVPPASCANVTFMRTSDSHSLAVSFLSVHPFFPSLFDDWVFVLPQNRLMLLGESAHLASVVVTR